MRQSDWIGLGASVVVHAGLLLLFAFMTVASDPPPVGFVQVEYGEFNFGQPTERTLGKRPETIPMEPEPQPERPEPTEEEVEEPETRADVPEQTASQPEDEVIPEPEQSEDPEPTEPEETEEEPEETSPEEASEPEPEPLGQGDPQGSSGATDSDEGQGSDQQKTAPFSLEGLDRVPQRRPLPDYTANVNATIKVHIVVDPQGRIVSMRPERKGNPALEQSVYRTLRKWKFNELPPNVPQENQEGAITFRFRLE